MDETLLRYVFTFSLFVFVVHASACGTGRSSVRSDAGASDATTNNDASSAGFASWCAETGSNYANTTCTGSSMGDICPGQLYCDACGRQVDVACTCQAHPSLSFAFECEDPCANCEVIASDGGAGDASAGDAGRTDAGGGELTSCVVHYGSDVGCLWLAETPTTAGINTIREVCEAQTSSDPPAHLETICPTGDLIGYCALNLEGHAVDYYFYAPTDPSVGESTCESIGIWIPL